METARSKQAGLNDVVLAKVDRKIIANRLHVEQTVARMRREEEYRQDFFAFVGKSVKDSAINFIPIDNNVQLTIPGQHFRLHKHAVRQIGSRFKISGDYLTRLTFGEGWQQELASVTLNYHFHNGPDDKLLVRGVEGQIRGVLSDKYKRLNSLMIFDGFIGETAKYGAVVWDAYMSDTKIWFETINPRPIVLNTEMNGQVVVFIGARLSSSDYGDGAVEMRTFVLNGICLNGMVQETTISKRHLGSKLGADFAFSERTYKLDTLTIMSALSDLTKDLFDPANIRARCREIEAACSIEVDFNHEIERLVKAAHISKEEGEQIGGILMLSKPDDGLYGGPSLWKLTQSVSAFARDAEPVRKRELETLTGDMLRSRVLNIEDPVSTKLLNE